MVQMRLAGGSNGAGGRSWKPFSLALQFIKETYESYCGQTDTHELCPVYIMWVPVRAVSLAVVAWL